MVGRVLGRGAVDSLGPANPAESYIDIAFFLSMLRFCDDPNRVNDLVGVVECMGLEDASSVPGVLKPGFRS